MTLILKQNYVCLVAAALLWSASSAHAQLENPVELIFQSAEAKAQNVIREAGAEGKGVVIEAAQGAIRAIAFFRDAYKDSLELTVDKLDGARAALFRDIRNTVDALGDTTAEATQNLDRTASKLALTMLSLPFMQNTPRVSHVRPLVSVAGDTTSQLAVSGLLLNVGTPSLTYGNVVARPVTATDIELTFKHPPVPPDLAAPQIFPGKLTVYERDRIFFVIPHQVAKEYPVQFVIYPRLIGQASMTPMYEKQTPIFRDRIGPKKECQSPLGEGKTTEQDVISASKDWVIMPETVRFNADFVKNGRSSIDGISASGFQLKLICEGSGKNWFDAGEKGTITGNVMYRETQMEKSLVAGTPVQFPFHWGDVLAHSWPESTQTVVLSLTPTITGKNVQLSGPGRMRFAQVEYDPKTRTTQLRARRIDEALREQP